MSWVCDVCSSDNDDDVRECFVCGAPRSAASLREAARRRRNEKRNAAGEVLCARVFPWLGIAALAASAVLVIAVIVCVIVGHNPLPAENIAAFGEEASGRATCRTDTVRDAFSHLGRPHFSQETRTAFGENVRAHFEKPAASPDGEAANDDDAASLMKETISRRAGETRFYFSDLSRRAADAAGHFRKVLLRFADAVRQRVARWKK